MKRSTNEAEAPRTAISPQPAKKTKKDTDIILPDDVWSAIVTFADVQRTPGPRVRLQD
eukprot:CAMPEP_0197553924 /NCGR_PEP_ID=MMETSP1320-20131121/10221_1 /TAXON_ID=91990 /ORGANISM="Bolidomonas sp., Strain RCC2347" /LENGTH=57 /DNA_ID=CAMNT_0043114755 /DNA_START=89 /DNA_END=259 /DNA_ORIENTATION=-